VSFSPKIQPRSVKMSKDGHEFEKILQSATTSPGWRLASFLAKDDDESPLKMIDKVHLRKVIRKVKKWNSIDKSEAKNFSQKLDNVATNDDRTSANETLMQDKKEGQAPKVGESSIKAYAIQENSNCINDNVK